LRGCRCWLAARLFIYFTPDNYGSGGCYNLSCSAFVQTTNTIVIGGPWSTYSSLCGAQYEVKLLWYKDGTTGNWWLRYGDT
jgi:Neprosin